MSEKNFPPVIEMRFYGLGKFRKGNASIDPLVQLPVLVTEDLGQSLATGAPFPEHKGLARWHVQFHRSNPRTILSSIMLLFHQQEKLIETPKRGPVFLRIIGKRFSQLDQRNATMMAYFVTHACLSLASLFRE